MDTFHEAFFSIFMLLWFFLMMPNIRYVCERSAEGFPGIRFWTVFPLALYGPLVVLNPWWHLGHLDRGRQFLGIWLVLWPIVSSIIASACKEDGSMGKWDSCQRSRGPFYILCVDLAIILFSIVENCRYPIPTGTSDWTFGGGLGKIMSMFVIILLAFQDIMLFPIAAFPRFISIPAIIIRRFFLPVQSKQAPKRWSYTVAQLLPQNPTGREKSLALILQDDKIVERVARHLHYDDLVNLSLASKLTRTAMFYPSMDPSSRQERIESLCIASCLDGQKSECWSCERVICDDCKSEKRTIQSSRVKDHFTHCYAVCTYCYLFSAPGGAAPFNAKWNMQDLEMQHINCCTFQQPQWEEDGGHLCRQCASLDGATLTAMKEARDEFYLDRTLPRTLDCAVCMFPISRRRMRWWFCNKGRHECHWAGHHT